MIETCVQAARNEKSKFEQQRGKYVFNRAMFLEFLFRLANHVISGKKLKKSGKVTKTTTVNKKDDTADTAAETSNETGISRTQAFYMFMEQRFVPYHEALMIRWQKFRNEELWSMPV